MQLVCVIRSYTGRVLEYGPIRIRPWAFIEYPFEEYKKLGAEVLMQIDRAKRAREIAVQMVADNKPVDEFNETTVLRMWHEQEGGPKNGVQ